MNSKRQEIGDERNASFELPALDDLKPGIEFGEQKRGDAAGGEDHRRPRREKKDIPQESLAERIRRARKGG